MKPRSRDVFSRFALTLVVLVATGCADHERPTKFREVCVELGAVTCAMDAREDACTAEPDEQVACIDEYITECCAFASCDSDVTWSAPTFEQYDACHAAIEGMTCDDVAARVTPSACEGID